MSKNLQLGIDIGRAIAAIERVETTNDLRAIAQKVIDALGIALNINEDSSFLLGLGYGLRDRREVPIEAESLKAIGGAGESHGAP